MVAKIREQGKFVFVHKVSVWCCLKFCPKVADRALQVSGNAWVNSTFAVPCNFESLLDSHVAVSATITITEYLTLCRGGKGTNRKVEIKDGGDHLQRTDTDNLGKKQGEFVQSQAKSIILTWYSVVLDTTHSLMAVGPIQILS